MVERRFVVLPKRTPVLLRPDTSRHAWSANEPGTGRRSLIGALDMDAPSYTSTALTAEQSIEIRSSYLGYTSPSPSWSPAQGDFGRRPGSTAMGTRW